MKHVLVLGAGRVARPCVQYLLRDPEFRVTAVDTDGENLARVLRAHAHGTGIVRDATVGLAGLLAETDPDAVVNLLPVELMATVAAACVDAGVHYVDPSYISDAMRGLAARAAERGVLLLCELGLDPGIDHMSAARTIRQIHDEGGQVRSFHSWCGALPSRAANDNPFGYKLSWAPAGLIGASVREARFLHDGEIVVRPGGETFLAPSLVEIEGSGWFEEYANADSLPYIAYYGIPEAKTVYRGTLRYPGWAETICAMQDLGLFELDELDFDGLSFAGLTRRLVDAGPGANLEAALQRFVGIKPFSAVFLRLRWLGLLDERPIPLRRGSLRDIVRLLFDEKLGFAPGESDVVVMEHRYVVDSADGSVTERRSTLVDHGRPDGDSAVARTTGIPAAIGARLVLGGEIYARGVQAPVLPEIYEPTLALLEAEGLRFRDTQRFID